MLGHTGKNSAPIVARTMDPEVRNLVVAQLLVIVIPVGTLFAIWLWMLTLRRL